MFIDLCLGVPRPLARANEGAKYLDQVSPGWSDKIDLDKLDLRDVELCVLGQLHGNFWKYVDKQEVDFETKLEGRGFYANYSIPILLSIDYWQLQHAWRKVILARRRAVALKAWPQQGVPA